MRPERIIVGEVRGPEAFDLLQANEHRARRLDGHASMPTARARRSRGMESMIMMGGFSPAHQNRREMITSSVDIIAAGGAPAGRLAQDHPHH